MSVIKNTHIKSRKGTTRIKVITKKIDKDGADV